jgi:uncharacterized phage protein (TIGR01671 family)
MLFDSKPGDCLEWRNGGQDIEVMQFTGLYDRNGREIYEGDIISWDINGNHHIAPVIFECGSFWMGKEKNGWCVYNDWGRGEYEILGNIHENPELLA